MSATTAGTKILVIDDSATVLRVVDAVLSRAGFGVRCLDSGRDAVEVARALAPALVIVDFAMPDVSGYGVCRALGRDPATDKIPIVLMNTRGDPIGDRFVREMGIVDHITKPFAPEALLAVIEHVLEKGPGARATPRPPPPPPYAVEPVPVAPVVSRVVLQGDMAAIPVAEVLQLLALQRQTGVLGIRRAASEISVFLKLGKVRLVTGTNLAPELLLGNILVTEKLIAAEELELLLANRRGTRKLLGSQVVQLGYVSSEGLHRALERQSTELVYELLRWGYGQFAFEVRDQLPAEVLEFELDLSIDVLLMEGFRRVDEWGLIESVLKTFDVVPAVNPGGVEHLGQPGLAPEEQAVLAAIDGKRSVHEIIREVGVPAFEVARILYRLVSARVVTLPPAPPLSELDGVV
ncbi:MAG: response regulator [Deltaproteobacteria bacterium]|nr:response regulator [Deltaproteobacteria bacterium]